MVLNKILGYVLLAAGLLLISWTLWQSYGIFTGKVSAPLVFQTSSEITSSDSGNSIQDQINMAVQNQLKQVLSPAAVTKLLNLSSWSLLAFILIWAGSAMSKIGVKLVKA